VVDTGKTLKENGLEALELISHVSSRLIVNKASFKRKADLIQPLLQQLSQAITPNAEG
jgi:ATP phosphoribosyltransferase